MRKPQDAAPIARELHRHAFADSAKALQFVMGQEAHVERERLIAAARGYC